ncbi:NAD(P)-binding domain-containing protein [Micrococcus sp.]|uniref:NAD(P)-binding domain-containing protein n=1 Tax=Micrococcus sp. TaxID=1271 RepID=UPI002A91D1FE|nr:NAD(P)-binding domain-containing protein [Micrococcus sp.]MDY6055778.1 NAD(P)-binding domain-containing protein [Micrococcus sp.]
MDRPDAASPLPGPLTVPDAVGILGAGRAGTALARAIARIPHLHPGTPAPRVVMAATRPPVAVQRHLVIHAPQATAVAPEEIAVNTALTVVAVPREELDEVDPAWLAGPRTLAVVDMTNTWQDESVPTWLLGDDAGAEPSSPAETGTVRIARRWAAAGLRVPLVRAFSEVSHHELDRSGRTEPPLRALGVGGDAPGPARDAVAALVRALGFDPVGYAPLARGAALEPGARAFAHPMTAAELTAALAQPLP